MKTRIAKDQNLTVMITEQWKPQIWFARITFCHFNHENRQCFSEYFLNGKTSTSGKFEIMKNEHSLNTFFHQHLNSNEAIGGNGNLGSIHLEIDVFFERVSEKNKRF